MGYAKSQLDNRSEGDRFARTFARGMDAIGLSEDSLGESGSTPYEILRDIVTVLNGADPDRVSDLNTFQEFVELMMDQGILSEPRFRGRLLGGN